MGRGKELVEADDVYLQAYDASVATVIDACMARITALEQRVQELLGEDATTVILEKELDTVRAEDDRW